MSANSLYRKAYAIIDLTKMDHRRLTGKLQPMNDNHH